MFVKGREDFVYWVGDGGGMLCLHFPGAPGPLKACGVVWEGGVPQEVLQPLRGLG